MSPVQHVRALEQHTHDVVVIPMLVYTVFYEYSNCSTHVKVQNVILIKTKRVKIDNRTEQLKVKVKI